MPRPATATPAARGPDGDGDASSAGFLSASRRRFLAAAGFTAAGLVAGAGGTQLLRSAQAGSGGSGSSRAERALKLRLDAARRQLDGDVSQPETNGDEQEYPPGMVSFTKALPHDPHGEVDPDAYRTLLRALQTGDPADFDQVPTAGDARLANPQAAFGFQTEGADTWGLIVPPPAFASEAFAGEMTECYWLALARDVPYSRFGQEPVTGAAIADLRRFDDFPDLDAPTLFAAPSPVWPPAPTSPSSSCSPTPSAAPRSSSGTARACRSATT